MPDLNLDILHLPRKTQALDTDVTIIEDGVTKGITVGNLLGIPVAVKSSDYVIVLSDRVILANAALVGIMFTLPDATKYLNRRLTIKKIDSSANPITIVTVNLQTIDDELTLILESKGESIDLVTDGSNWYIL